MDHYPDDQVNSTAVASIRRSMDWVLEQLPAGQRDRLESGDPDPAVLATVIGLLVDIVWWLDTCTDEEVDPDVAVKLLESVGIDGLSGGQRQRLLEILGHLAASEQHDLRRYELRFFPFAMGLVVDEPDDERPVRRWVPPEARIAGPAGDSAGLSLWP
ncbi:hypothetical protein Rhe02_19430 [Rhizocola hellebori]|uniref:Uncharacterized protein n=2 Tax=Rhizocola hellebori TaxID=1392758 RepID=A0A8J3Q5V4_9ACTN|nr:hypothetical protein Rhe02_19430 [Rhizocola hellebori]